MAEQLAGARVNANNSCQLIVAAAQTVETMLELNHSGEKHGDN